LNRRPADKHVVDKLEKINTEDPIFKKFKKTKNDNKTLHQKNMMIYLSVKTNQENKVHYLQ
jgi:hypothetical protein